MRAELIAAMEQHLGAEWSQQYEPRHFAGLVASYIESELWNKGYQIVPAGAVTLSAEEAATFRDLALFKATMIQEELQENELGLSTETYQLLIDQMNEYRALAAKLSGGAS